MRHDVASCGSVSTLDSIFENEASLTDSDFDKDMAYAAHINPHATLGDKAAVAALFAEDTDEVGILDSNAGTEHRTQTDPEGASKLTPAAKTGEGKIATGASLPNAI